MSDDKDLYDKAAFTNLCGYIAALIEYALLSTIDKVLGYKWNSPLGFAILIIIVTIVVVAICIIGDKAEEKEDEALKDWCEVGVISLIAGIFIILMCFGVYVLKDVLFETL